MKVKHVTQYLFESYKDAQAKFVQEASEEEVKQYLDTFKELTKKGTVSGQEKDIGYWIRQGWNLFKEFVDSKSQEKSKSQVKKSKKKDSIVVRDDENYFMVIPLTREASCFYGKNTKWCTSATETKNYFIDYFYRDRESFMYIIDKNTHIKYAVVYDINENKIEAVYDENDKKVGSQIFQNNTKISLQYIKDHFIKNIDTIEKAMDINNVNDETLVDIIKSGAITLSEIDNPSEDVQLEIIKMNPQLISDINNPSENVIYQALRLDPRETIENIDEKYITEKLAWEALKCDIETLLDLALSETNLPTKEMVDYVFEKNPLYAVQFYENVTQDMAWKVVKKHPKGLRILKNETNGEYPTQEMAMYYFDNFPEIAIEFLDNPSVEQQFKAVYNDPSSISIIEKPANEVIEYIISLDSDELAMKLTANPTLDSDKLDKDIKNRLAKVMGF